MYIMSNHQNHSVLFCSLMNVTNIKTYYNIIVLINLRNANSIKNKSLIKISKAPLFNKNGNTNERSVFSLWKKLFLSGLDDLVVNIC